MKIKTFFFLTIVILLTISPYARGGDRDAYNKHNYIGCFKMNSLDSCGRLLRSYILTKEPNRKIVSVAKKLCDLGDKPMCELMEDEKGFLDVINMIQNAM